MRQRDRDLDMMQEELEQMELQGGGRSDARLQRDVEDANLRAEAAERRLNDLTSELDVVREQLERAKTDIREEQRRTTEAQSKVKSAEDDVKELSEQLAAERQKASSRRRDDVTDRERAAQRNQEVARYQKENKLLAEENERLNGRLEELMAECVGLSESLVQMDDAAQAWRGREADVEAAAEGLRRERDKLAAQLETARMDLEERTHLLQTFEEKFSEEYARWEKERADLRAENAGLRASGGLDVARAYEDGGGVGSAFSAPSPRRRETLNAARVGGSRQANPEDPRYVEELESEVAELRDLRVLLLEAYDQLERDVGREVDIALKRQAKHHANLEAKVGVQEQALEAESKRFRTMDKALHDAQEDLAEAQGRLAQYEAGVYGLSEAMRDLKALRMQVRAADQQVEDAVAQSNALGRKVEDLTEETRFLRQQAGIPEDADIDLGGFKLKSKVEAAQLRALNSQLEREVADLEEDRRRLRNELRYRAKWQGEHAARLGLSARQLAMLEEYADALRFGNDAVFKEDLVRYDGSSASDTEGQAPAVRYDPAVGIGARAVQELEAANKQLQERLAEALERLQSGGTGIDGLMAAMRPPEGQQQQQPMSQPDYGAAAAAAIAAAVASAGGSQAEAASAAQVAELQQQLARARQQIMRLEDGYHEAMMRSSVQQMPPAMQQQPMSQASQEMSRQEMLAEMTRQQQDMFARMSQQQQQAFQQLSQGQQQLVLGQQGLSQGQQSGVSNSFATEPTPSSMYQMPQPPGSPVHPSVAEAIALAEAKGAQAIAEANAKAAAAQAAAQAQAAEAQRMMAEMSQQQQEAFQRMSQQQQEAFAHMSQQQQQSLLASQTQAAAAAGATAVPATAPPLAAPVPERPATPTKSTFAQTTRPPPTATHGTITSPPAMTAPPMPAEPVVPSSMYGDAVRTVERLRGERDALFARVSALQAALDAAPGFNAQQPVSFNIQAAAPNSVTGGMGGQQTNPAVAAGAYAEAQRAREECAAADRALAGVIADLAAKEEQLEQMAIDVAKYKQAFADMGATRSALYREHVRAKTAWAEERRTLAERARRAETEAETNAVEARDAQTLVERLKPGAESGLKEALAAAHSRLVVLQVREVRLSRALETASTAEAQARKDKEEMEIDVQELSRAAQERLAFHERRAAEAELRAARCQRELDLCVPKHEHATLADNHRTLQARFKELLALRADNAVSAAQLRAAKEDASTARAEAEASTLKAQHEKARARELSLALDAVGTKEGRDAFSQVEARKEIAEVRAQLDAGKRAAELAARETRRVAEARDDLEESVRSLETELSRAKAQLHESREAERQHLQKLSRCVSEDKHRAEMEAVVAAEEEAARLRSEVIKAENAKAAAETELGKRAATNAARDAELASLRAAVREMERRSDAAAALARANEETVRLKSAAAQLKHEKQVAEAEADRLHGDCLRLHRRLQVQDSRLFGLREDARNLLQAQEAALARAEAALAGRIDAADAEKWERALNDLRKGAARREALLADAHASVKESAERADKAEFELVNLQKYVKTAEARDKGDSDKGEDAALREIRSLGEELLQSKLLAARTQRACAAAEDRLRFLEAREREREEHVLKIEEATLTKAQAGDVRADDLQRQVRALQRELIEARNPTLVDGTLGERTGKSAQGGSEDIPAPRRRANAEALAAVGAAAAVGVQPGAASVETQRMVLQQIEAIRALKVRAAEAESKCATFEREVSHAQASAKNAENERDALRRRLEAHIAASAGGLDGGGIGAPGSLGEESAVAQVTAVAQSTIARLQELVSEKNAALTRAQTAMADLRTDALKKQAEDRKTIEELNELLFKQNQREIKSMKEALDFGPRPGGGGGSDAKTLAGKPVAELVALLAERESMIETLTMKFEQQRARHEAAEAQLAERAEIQQGEIARMFEEVDREKSKGPSRVVETLVSRLKAQMAEKDKRLAQLKEAIKTLEKKLVEAMQTAASRTIRSSDASRAELEHGRGADDRAQKLAAKLKKTQDELAKARERAEVAEADLRLRSSSTRAAPGMSSSSVVRGDHSREDAEAAKAANERADELEKRVKVLTAQNAKLNRLLDGEKVPAGGGGSTAPRSPARKSHSHVENQPPASLASGGSKEREDTLARWEEGVKLRKKAEQLAKKLAARTKENEELERQMSKRDRALQDVTKERNALQTKTQRLTHALETASGAGGSSSGGGGGGPDAAAVKEVVDENEALHREVAALQRTVDVEQAAEIARLKRQLASAGQSQVPAASTTSRYPSAEAAELAERVRSLEGEVLARDDAALSLRFEAEQASARADRLQRRVDRLFKDLAEGATSGGKGSTGAGGKDVAGRHARRVQELEDVVEALKKVVEKQQGELAGLRGQAAAAARGNEHARAAKELRLKVRDMESDMVGLRRVEKEHKELLQRSQKLELQVKELKDEIKRGGKGARAAEPEPKMSPDDQALLVAAQSEAAATSLQLMETREALSFARMESDRLARQLAQRGDGGDDAAKELRARITAAEVEIKRLQNENADLRAELDALDPAFFDEVMEMKRAYHEQAEVLGTYEDLLRRYSSQLGVEFTPATTTR